MSGVPGAGASGSYPRGRGRGRARTMQQTQPAPTPGGLASTATQEHGSEIGRRAATGRRGADMAPTTPTKGDKAQRESPPTTRSPNSETEKMAALDIISMASRPGFGTLGRKYRMFANHFETRFTEKVFTVNRYQIEINLPPPKTPRELKNNDKPYSLLTRDDNRVIFWKCLLDNRVDLGLSGTDDMYKVAYDGVHTCFTLHPLNVPFDKHNDSKKYEVEVIVSRFDRAIKVIVQIQTTGPIVVDFSQVASPNLSERTTTPIQVIDILLRQYRSCPYSDYSKLFYPFRNSIFMIPGSGDTPSGIDLGGGREIWKGLFASAHIVDGNRALVNMDVDHTAFYKFSMDGGRNGNGNGQHYGVVQYMCDVLNEAERSQKYNVSQLGESTALNQIQKNMFEREIKTLKVCIDYEKPKTVNKDRKYGVKKLGPPAAECYFLNRENVTMSVAEYYAQTYGPLKFPMLPTLVSGGGKKEVQLPMERCYLSTNQKVMKKLTENQTAIMIKQTCMAPESRKASIEQMVHHGRFNEDPFLKAFGFEMSKNMMCVDGRVLPPPSLGYGGGQSVQTRDGVWRSSGTKFHMPASAAGVAAIAFSRAPNSAEQFVGGLMDCCRQCGMTMPSGNNVVFHLEMNTSPQRVEIAFSNVLERMKRENIECQLIIVFLQQKGGQLYSDVKKIGEIQMGVMTQCVVHKTVDRSSSDTLMNIAMKINMKLGGINCVLQSREQAAKCLFEVPTLVLGIDVTHPGPMEKRKPSVASVVGSMDLSQMRYAASIKIQKQRDEHLVYVVDKVIERLMAFYKATQHKPERIVVYRDGVSEGQFQQVLREELRGVREACTKVDANYRPKITFIVVQKRHHTRLFPENSMDGCGKAKNVYPGSVIDNYIVHPDEFVFYLCSHAGIQGTSRPSRYYVLHDDNNFATDQIQMMTYYLCHCFSRCTRSISIPAPVYYADLACTRARAHLQSAMGDSLSDTTSTHSGEDSSSGPPEDDLIAATTVTDNIRKEMYFT